MNMIAANAGVLLCSLGTGLLVLQAVPYHRPLDPPVNMKDSIEAHLDVPPEVSGILNRACADCHSNRTRWPGYSRVAPLSWLVAEDVEQGRDALNLSEWSTKTGRRPGTAIGALMSVCESIKSRHMPPAAYILMHREASLSDADTATLCTWTASAVQHERVEMTRRLAR